MQNHPVKQVGELAHSAADALVCPVVPDHQTRQVAFPPTEFPHQMPKRKRLSRPDQDPIHPRRGQGKVPRFIFLQLYIYVVQPPPDQRAMFDQQRREPVLAFLVCEGHVPRRAPVFDVTPADFFLNREAVGRRAKVTKKPSSQKYGPLLRKHIAPPSTVSGVRGAKATFWVSRLSRSHNAPNRKNFRLSYDNPHRHRAINKSYRAAAMIGIGKHGNPRHICCLLPMTDHLRSMTELIHNNNSDVAPNNCNYSTNCTHESIENQTIFPCVIAVEILLFFRAQICWRYDRFASAIRRQKMVVSKIHTHTLTKSQFPLAFPIDLWYTFK
jgi:hypothetical protein